MEKIIAECKFEDLELVLTDKNLIVKLESEIEFFLVKSIKDFEFCDDDKNSYHNQSYSSHLMKAYILEESRKYAVYSIILGFVLTAISTLLLFKFGFIGNGKIGGASIFIIIFGGFFLLRGLSEYSSKKNLIELKKIRINFIDDLTRDFSFSIRKKDDLKISQFTIQVQEFKMHKN